MMNIRIINLAEADIQWGGVRARGGFKMNNLSLSMAVVLSSPMNYLLQGLRGGVERVNIRKHAVRCFTKIGHK